MSRTVGKTDNFHPGFTGRQLARLDTYGSLAQLVEQRFYTAKVGGSSPSGTTKFLSLSSEEEHFSDIEEAEISKFSGTTKF